MSEPSSRYHGPLLLHTHAIELCRARDEGAAHWTGSLDLGRSQEHVGIARDSWVWREHPFSYPPTLKERAIHYWDGETFAPAARYSGALIKLVPTAWGVPTFEIDGIKMLPTAKASPLDDARHKIALLAPAGKRLLDTCGGLGYFAACALDAGVARVDSFEKNPDVLWLRTLNPWSPDPQATAGRLQLQHADIARALPGLADASFDAIAHDPPRFSIAGELYALDFYRQLARVLRRGGRMFHYTGTPNQVSRGRDLPREVARRLHQAGFRAEPALDGVLATRS